MKQIQLTKAIDRAIQIKLKAVDAIMEELVEPLADVGNPEKLIKKPYEQWTAQDLQFLRRIYGEGEDTPLTRLIFKKTYERVQELEAQEV
jgi:hypothetical protein